MLEFFDIKSTNGTASIYDSYITFSKSLVNYLEDAYRVRVAVNKEEKKIYFFKINKDYAMSNELNPESLLKVGISKTYARVCSKQMMQFIFSSFNLKIEKKGFLRADAYFDENDNAIIITLSEVIE